MLALATATAPDWAERVLSAPDELLVDHAHCEKKAAGLAVNLIFRYPQHGFLLEPLSRLAREELVHFEQVLALLAQRGARFGLLKPAPYAGRLRKEVRGHEPARLIDTLLCCALIEARSCERFGLLAEAARDADLRALYAGLRASEARHHGVYVGLAEALAPRDAVRTRLGELARREAEILASAPCWACTLDAPRPGRACTLDAPRPDGHLAPAPGQEDPMAVATERVEIPLDAGGTMGGYLARPEGDATLPGVILYMEIFGINSHIRDVAERVAAEGYVVVAPDFFHRTGPGVEYGYDDAGMGAGMKLLGALDADEMISDARAVLAYLRGRPDTTGKVGAMGFCIGGHMTYLTACETDVDVAASFYGGGIAAPQGPGGKASTLRRTGGISGRILCLFGEKDALIPGDQVAAIRTALAEKGVDHEVIVYPDADHGFFCDQRASYQKAAADDAWKRVKALFAATLG